MNSAGYENSGQMNGFDEHESSALSGDVGKTGARPIFAKLARFVPQRERMGAVPVLGERCIVESNLEAVGREGANG